MGGLVLTPHARRKTNPGRYELCRQENPPVIGVVPMLVAIPMIRDLSTKPVGFRRAMMSKEGRLIKNNKNKKCFCSVCVLGTMAVCRSIRCQRKAYKFILTYISNSLMINL